MNHSGDGVTFRVTDSAWGWVGVEFFPKGKGKGFRQEGRWLGFWHLGSS